MAEYQLTITVIGQDQTAPAIQGMERLGVGGIAAGNLLASALQQAAGAVVGFAGTAIKSAGDFEQGMAGFANATGQTLAASGKSLDDFKQLFLSLGAELPVSTAEVQQAAIAMATGGIDPATIAAGGLKDTIQFASAALKGDLVAAATISAKTMQAWTSITDSAGQKTEFMSHAQNLMAQATTAASTTVDQLFLGLSNVGGTARLAGASFDETVTSLAQLTPSFASSADAGTSFKTFLSRLQPTTKPAIAAMQELGLATANGTSKFYDAKGNFIGMAAAEQLLHGATANLTQAQREQALATIFGNDGIRAAAVFAAQGSAGYDALSASIAQQSTVQESAARNQATFNTALDNFKGSVEALQITIGMALIPVLTQLFNTILAPAINTITQFATAMLSAADPVQFLVASIDSVIPGFAAFVDVLMMTATAIQGVFAPAIAFVQANLAAFESALAGVGAALAGLAVVFIAWPAILGAVGAVLGVIGTALAFLLSPIGLLIIGAAALGAAISTNFMGIGDLFNGLIPIFTTITTIIGQVIAAFGAGGLAGAFVALQAGLAVVGPMLMAWGAQLGTVLLSIGQLILTNVMTWGQAFVAWIAPYVPIVLTALGTLALSIGSWIITVAAGFIVQLASWGLAFVNWIAPYVSLALTALAGFAASIWAWIVAQAPGFVAQLAAWGLAFVNWIAPYAALALTTLGGFVASVWGWIVAQAPGFIAQLAAWGQAFIAWIGPMIPPAIAALAGLASAFFGWIAAQAAPILAQLGTWAQALVAWIVPATVQFLAAWPGMLSGFLDWIASAVPPILAKLGAWALAFVQWIAPMIPPFLLALAGIALAVGAFIVETAAVLIGKLAQWGIAFIAWIAPLIGKIPAALEGINAAIGRWIIGAAVSLVKSAAELGKNIINGIIGGVSSAQNALAEKLKSIAKGALDAAKSALGIHSPSVLMAQEVGEPIVAGIAQGIKNGTPKATTAMLDLAGKLFDTISKGADAFGKLRDLGHVSMSAVTDFTTTLQQTIQFFAEMVNGWDKAMLSAASQFTLKATTIVDFLSKGIDALIKLQQFHGVPQATVHAFAVELASVITELINISTIQMRMAMGAAAEFSAGAGKVIDILAKGVDGFAKLATFTALPAGVTQQFAVAVWWVVTKIAEVAKWISADATAAAGRFADGAGKVLGLLGSGMDGFAKLATFTALPTGVTQKFAVAVWWTVAKIAEVAGWIGADAVAAAAAFADGAGKVIGIIGAGVEGFAKLKDFGPVSVLSLDTFTAAVSQMVAKLLWVAVQFDAKGVAAAGVFAESAGKILGIIGSGVEGFTKLASFTGVSQAAVTTFGTAVAMMVARIQTLALQFSADGVAAAGVFADGASKVLGIIGNGVTGLNALAGLGPVSQAGMDAFEVAVDQLMTRIAAIATRFSATGIAAAGAFADAAGKSVGILKTGVEGFLFVDTFTGVSEAAIGRFADGVRLAVAAMVRLANEFGGAGVAAAAAFANAAGQSTDFLKKGVEGFNKLADLQSVPQAALDLFASAVVDLITTIIQLSTVVTTDVLAQAIRFANGMDQVIQVVSGGLEAITKLGQNAAGIPAFIQAFTASVAKLAADFAAQVTPPAVNIGYNIATGIANGITAGAPAIQTALAAAINQALAGLAAIVVPPATNIGHNIAIGIANGITGAAPAIQNAIFAAINQALAAARAALGIASPSKVFEQQIGAQMSAGMAQGVLGGMGGVQTAVGQVSTSALTAGAVGGSGSTNNSYGGDTYSITINQQPGQDARALADTVMREIENRRRMRS